MKERCVVVGSMVIGHSAHPADRPSDQQERQGSTGTHSLLSEIGRGGGEVAMRVEANGVEINPDDSPRSPRPTTTAVHER